MLSFLNSPVVKKARMYGFRPLFLIKNLSLNKSDYGIRGMQFETDDKNAKTAVMLAGLWRAKDDDFSKLEFIALDADGKLLSHGDVFD
jgi:hypothetical protein